MVDIVTAPALWALSYLSWSLSASIWWNVLISLLLLVQIGCNGAEHGHIWARGGWRDRPWPFDYLRVHLVDGAHEPSYYLLAFLTGANPIAVFAAGIAGRPLFEGLINRAVGRAWHEDGSEPDDFTVRWGGDVIYSRPKPEGKTFYLVQAVGGSLLWAAHPFISPGLVQFAAWASNSLGA